MQLVAASCYRAELITMNRRAVATNPSRSGDQMAERLTAQNCTDQLKTKFRLMSDDEIELELELDEVQPFPDLTHARGDMERFSLYFVGPGDKFLPQGMRRLEHDHFGELEIFLVPVGQDSKGFRYEAVFSYFKES